MWRKSFLQCENWARLKGRDFHVTGEEEKWALEFISWRSDWQGHNGEKEAVVIQRHDVEVWGPGRPKQGGHRGPAQPPWQPRLGVSQVSTSHLPLQVLLGEFLPHPPEGGFYQGEREGTTRHMGGWVSRRFTAKDVMCWANRTLHHHEGIKVVSAFFSTF